MPHDVSALNRSGKPVLAVGLTPALQRTLRFARLQPGEVHRARSVTVSPAGKGVNVALVLKQLNVPVCLLTFLGGVTGEQVRDELDARGVQTTCIDVDAPTRFCQTLLDESTGEVTELVEECACPSSESWKSLREAFSSHLPDCSLVIISGTLMPGASEQIYADMVAESAKHGRPVLIDSHREPLRRTLSAKPFLVKLNAQEIAVTTGLPVDTPETLCAAAQELIVDGAGAVVVTQGARDTWLVQPDSATAFPPARIKAVNPIGSGDAMTAGIAAGLLDGKPLVDAVRFGMACGAANALTMIPAEIRRDELAGLVSRHP